MTIKYYTQSQIDQQASVIGQRLRGITSDLTELVHSSVSKPAPNISSFLAALEKGFNPSSDAPSYDTGLAKDYSGTGWYKATDTGTIFCKDIADGETYTFDGTTYTSVYTKEQAKTLGTTAAVSNITDISYIFEDEQTFNQDISGWDVSNVTNMAHAFNNSSASSSSFSNWDVSNVTNMNYLFSNNPVFNQDISSWDVSSVTTMEGMFSTTPFNQDISGWDVSNVTNMFAMFYVADAFNQDLSEWCVTLIPTQPEFFDREAAAWNKPKPVWGTCPRGENTSD